MARKILLADDSVTAQNMGRKILADAGYEIVTVNNGSAALKRITEIKPDLIVLDVYMPGYSGLEVCQRLKDAPETAHIPVLLTVGKLEPFKPEEARRVRADGHIVKPFEASELLTAITRLEDRMVASQPDGSRFATSVSGVERFGGEEVGKKNPGADDSDTGWKSRLRFPSKKKKEEPEPEPEEIAASANFRDFRKTKGKSGSGLAFTVKEPAPPGQEPGLVPDIPRDITPEELDALSALAARLDGPIPATENIPSPTSKIEKAPVAAIESPSKSDERHSDAAKTEVAKTELEPPAAPIETIEKTETTKTAHADASPLHPEKETNHESPVAEPAAPVLTAPVEQQVSVVIPVQHTEPAPEIHAPIAASAVAEIRVPETLSSKTAEIATPPVVPPVPVEVAALVEAPAPVDRADEPLFEVAANFAKQTAEATISATEVEKDTVVAAATETEQPTKIEAATSAEPALAKDEKPEHIAAKLEEKEEKEDPKPTQINSSGALAEPVSEAPLPGKVEPEELAPSDEELAEALRLLTPSIANTDTSAIPSQGTLVAAGQLLAEEVTRHASHPRWVAEPIPLSAQESALSLEAEMFQTFAVAPLAVSSAESEAVRMTGVSAIAAAVENRMAALDLAPNNIADIMPVAEAKPEAAMTAASPTESSAIHTSAPAPSASKSSAVISEDENKLSEEKNSEPVELAPVVEAATSESAIKAPEENQTEDYAGGTFADAVGAGAGAHSANQHDESMHTAMPAPGGTEPAPGNNDSSSDLGGEDMASKSGKSTWHQIRTGPAPAATGPDAVEAAKQAAGQAAEETPKAMAAAAAAEGSAATASTTDASTIASIVDSVMADLRPKIVEEIAKKLAGK